MSEYSKTQMQWILLCSTTGVGPKTFLKILCEAVDIGNFFDNCEEILERIKLPEVTAINIKNCVKYSKYEFFETLNKLNIHAVCMFDSEYPVYLKNIEAPPCVLYVLGDLAVINYKTMGMVGTRRCSKAGSELAFEIAYGLAANDVCVISGMAKGIDTAAHAGALSAKGVTVAVLAGGVEEIFPKSNEKLYHKIIETGAVVSENPPGFPVLKTSFAARNRIIVGISRGVYVGESPLKGGSAITARLAAEFDRAVFTTVFENDFKNNELPKYLKESGGINIKTADSILFEMDWEKESVRPVSQQEFKKVSDKKIQSDTNNLQLKLDFLEQELYNLLLSGECLIDYAQEKLNIPSNKLLSTITMMELKGIIGRKPGNMIAVKK